MGQYHDLKASVRAAFAHQREVAAGRSSSEVREARARLETAKAKLAEMKVAQAEGTLVDAREVEETWRGMISRCRSPLLAIPARLQFRMGHLGRTEIGIIDQELRDALTELAHDPASEARHAG